MIDLVGILIGILIACGIILAAGLTPRRVTAPDTSEEEGESSVPLHGWALRRRTWVTRWHRHRLQLILAALSIVAGVIIGALTGWWVAMVLVPALAVGIPALLRPTAARRTIARLEALEDWTRSLAGVLIGGRGLDQALQAATAPKAIQTEVNALTARLRAGSDPIPALERFADDLDDATGDLVAAALVLGARQQGDGLSSVLEGLASATADDVRIRRSIQSDRAKPRTTIRWLMGLTFAVGVYALINRGWSAPYATPLGQLILATLIGIDALVLVWVRKLEAAATLPRFMTSDDIVRRVAQRRAQERTGVRV